MEAQNFHSPFAYSHNISTLIRKEKSYKKFSDVLEESIIPLLRMMVEYRSLISQLSTMQQQQKRMMPDGSGIYTSMASTTSGRAKSNTISRINDLSVYHKYNNDDYTQIVGYKSHICKRCLIINVDTIFRHKDRQREQIDKTHTCNFKRLKDAHMVPNKDKTIDYLDEKLPEIMKKKVNSWTKDSVYLAAIEMPPNVVLKNCFQITPNNENHWAVRAIKYKRTILKDDELSDLLHKIRHSTYAFFEVISSSLQQQQQESSTSRYLMIIADNKLDLSLELILQYVADLSR